MNQRLRQNAILTLVDEAPVPSQEELQSRLRRKGFRVGQATLSRDIRKLGLVKSARGYQVSAGDASGQPMLPSVEHLIREFVLEVREAQNLLVLKTTVGSASPVAVAIDSTDWEEVVGTVGGDDTILIITPDAKQAAVLAKRVRGMLA